MSEVMERTETDFNRIHALFLDKTALRLEAMCENFASGSWATPVKKSLMSNAFNIKNEAFSLGYTLISKTADSFCAYIDGIRYPTETQRMIMAKHLDIMRNAVIQNISGEGGEVGRELLHHLQLLIQKFQE